MVKISPLQHSRIPPLWFAFYFLNLTFWLPNSFTTIGHKMDISLIGIHNKCWRNVICLHQIKNHVNHGGALNKLIWWKFSCNSGCHMVNPTHVLFHDQSKPFSCNLNLPHLGLMNSGVVDCIIHLKMGCLILVDSGWLVCFL